MRSIGNGMDIHVWADKWVFDGNPRRPVNKEPLIDINMKVAQLINSQGEWNLHRLHELFPQCDVTRINSFPPVINRQDRFVWAYTKDGQYSVKSGNWLLTHEAKASVTVSDQLKALNEIKQRT